jgi:carbon storage regulator CsrA
MLVLSRRRDEKIVVKVPGVEEEIEVTVVQIDSSRVRLGFTAPQNVTILRSELQCTDSNSKNHAVNRAGGCTA